MSEFKTVTWVHHHQLNSWTQGNSIMYICTLCISIFLSLAVQITNKCSTMLVSSRNMAIQFLHIWGVEFFRTIFRHVCNPMENLLKCILPWLLLLPEESAFSHMGESCVMSLYSETGTRHLKHTQVIYPDICWCHWHHSQRLKVTFWWLCQNGYGTRTRTFITAVTTPH